MFLKTITTENLLDFVLLHPRPLNLPWNNLKFIPYWEMILLLSCISIHHQGSFFIPCFPFSRRCCTSPLAKDRSQNRLVWLCNRLGSRDATQGEEVLGQVSNLLAVTAARGPPWPPRWMYILIGFRPFLRSSLDSSFHGPFSILTLIVLVPRWPPVFHRRGRSFCAHERKFASTASTIPSGSSSSSWLQSGQTLNFHRKFVRRCLVFSSMFRVVQWFFIFDTFRSLSVLWYNETIETRNLIYSLRAGCEI